MRVLLACVLLCSACVVSTAYYQRILDGWVGKTDTELVIKWGVPTNRYEMRDGSSALEYVRDDGRIISSAVAVSSTMAIASATKLDGCITTFILSPSGKIVHITFRGDCAIQRPYRNGQFVDDPPEGFAPGN